MPAPKHIHCVSFSDLSSAPVAAPSRPPGQQREHNSQGRVCERVRACACVRAAVEKMPVIPEAGCASVILDTMFPLPSTCLQGCKPLIVTYARAHTPPKTPPLTNIYSRTHHNIAAINDKGAPPVTCREGLPIQKSCLRTVHEREKGGTFLPLLLFVRFPPSAAVRCTRAIAHEPSRHPRQVGAH